MTRPRIKYTVLNAKWTILMNTVLLVVNFFSRNIFLAGLGDTLVGLTSTMVGYIGFLNLMDLGIGTAVTQALYGPISIDNRNEIRRIISLFGFMFRWVGITVACSAIVLSCFFPVIFANDNVALTDVYAAFYTYLLMTLMSYFINYRQAMFIAAQKSFLLTRSYNLILVIKYSLQMLAVGFMGLGYISWLIIEFACQLFYVIWLEKKINKEYPWLKSSVKEGKSVRKEYPGIFKNIKRIFSSRIASVGLAQSDNIILQNMLSLADVANYGNFTMITGRISRIITMMFTTTYASIGNIIALKDHLKARLVFRQLTAMYFWGGCTLAFGFAMFSNSFVSLWLKNLGVTYSDIIVTLISINMFISIIRMTYESFLNAYGLFGDYPSAWAEFILNILLSVILTYYYGLIGTIIGTTVSTFLIGIIWKPYYLFTRGFHDKVIKHYMLLIHYLILALVTWFVTHYIFETLIKSSQDGWIDWILSATAVTLFFTIVLGTLLYVSSRGMRELVKMVLDTIRSKFAKL